MTATEQALTWARLAAAAASEKMGLDIVAYDVSEQLIITDILVIVTGNTDRQVGAITDGVIDSLIEHGVKPLRREGERTNRWVLLDYGEIIVHVQHREERVLYALERLWRDCPRVDLRLPDDS